MKIALYPGSFDPVTLGHLDIAERAASLFDKLIIAISASRQSKTMLFTPETRLQMFQQAVAHLPNVEVQLYTGLTVHFAQKLGASVLIRGLRTVTDFDMEMQLSQGNQILDAQIDTVCLFTNQHHIFISSSLVKDIALNGGPVAGLVPAHVEAALTEKYQQKIKQG
jgi:pantetheine-phosphate adenylyltransferase